MTPSATDPERIPVVITSGQAIERDDLVSPVDLMERACLAALADVPLLRDRIDRLTVVDIMTRTGPAPATELADRVGLGPDVAREVTTVGGNTPQWLVSRAASEIAAGGRAVTLIAGAEAIRSSRARRNQGLPRDVGRGDLTPDPVVGDDLPGFGPAEQAASLLAPVHVYPLFESVLASRAGHDAATHRRALGELMAPFTTVAASHPYAWFREERTPESIATPSPDNRIVCEPYTKRMTAFLGSDQAAALVVCSLAAAERAGVADRAVFVWSGAEAVDVRFVASRPDLGRSPAIEAAGAALFAAASVAAGRSVGIDDIERMDIYSCFPSAVQMAADALGIAHDDPRGLTVTGGLPYFGGPGNNYTTHGIASLCDVLRDTTGAGTHLGLATGLGWFVTKHALGVYGSTPPPAGFRRGDTTDAQAAIDRSAVGVAASLGTAAPATVVAATVWRDNDGSAAGAPVIARLADGRHMALAPADDEVVAAMGDLDIPGVVGGTVVVQAGEPRYRLAEH
ncbi:MAG: acetyl-CoA acetyltransferase [Acidimicrobiales bacterium]